ncbi:TetR family transcriptional regulator [Paenibacillus sp. SSG-1]|uniref:TetR/AcrR family transcriptional regulator n=1 Tax=Paenibacillus sp. SSG-1 TaxID=1443669 RepID=UPI000B7F94F1|nr:TetR/AcrR family transcriptional regulator [Paenibacillus sp. SSG-1]OXL85757.1 TetR family transcriptional regulator [Paenibacillus sp. SSG-1]
MNDRIMEVVRHEIKRRGLRFTMAELAKLSGMSTKTLYGIFSSKEELITAILDDTMNELKEKEKAILENNELSTLTKLKKCLVLVPADFQFVDMNLITDLQRFYPLQWKLLDQFLNQQWDSILSLFNEGISEGILRSFNTELFIDLYVGGFYRLIEDPSARKSNKGLQESLEDMVDILLSGIVQKEG